MHYICLPRVYFVKDRYLHHSAARDQYAGRGASGIPVVDKKFSVSPPYFDASQKEGTTEIEVQVEVDRVVDSICSPDTSQNLKKGCEMLLASFFSIMIGLRVIFHLTIPFEQALFLQTRQCYLWNVLQLNTPGIPQIKSQHQPQQEFLHIACY